MVAASKTEETDQITSPCIALFSLGSKSRHPGIEFMVAASKTEEADQITSPCIALISFGPVNTENTDKNEFHQELQRIWFKFGLEKMKP